MRTFFKNKIPRYKQQVIEAILENNASGLPGCCWTDLSGAVLVGCFLNEKNFSNTDLSEAILVSVGLQRGILKKANLTKASLKNAQLKESNFEQACLFQTDLAGADLEKANFYLANLKKANLKKAKLFKANLLFATLKYASISDSNFKRANLMGANLHGALLNYANLTHANLTGANLFNTSLKEAILKKANFNGANLARTDFRGADLREENFKNCDLSLTNITGTKNIALAYFEGTVLTNAQQCLIKNKKPHIIKTLVLTPQRSPYSGNIPVHLISKVAKFLFNSELMQIFYDKCSKPIERQKHNNRLHSQQHSHARHVLKQMPHELRLFKQAQYAEVKKHMDAHPKCYQLVPYTGQPSL